MNDLTTNHLARLARKTGYMIALLAATASVRAQAAADAPAANETLELQPFTITGSNIKRLDAEKTLPVTVIRKDTMSARNASTPVELLTTLPQLTSVPASEGASNATGARGDNANINLRGIGVSGTLVLLNGRRLAPHPFTSTLAYGVNVNQLPTQGIGHIDVLRDGASSIYGSDAVAGVVNFMMDPDFTGTEVRARYGAPEHGGGETLQGSVVYGRDFANGRGHWVSTVEYLDRNGINLSDRSFSATANHIDQAPPPFDVAGSVFDGRAAVGLFPTFRIGTATTTNYFRPVSGVMTLTSAAPNRVANPEFYLDVNAYTMGISATNRINTYHGFEYKVSDRLTAFANVLYYQAQSTISRFPTRINAPSSDQLAPLSIDNPFNPYGSRFYSPTGAPNADGTARLTGAPRAITLLAESLADFPAEVVNTSSGTYRLVGGLRGKLGETWNWETGGLLSGVYMIDKVPYAARESLFLQALQRTDTTAYNPFGYTFKVQGGAVVADQPYHNPESVLSTFREEWRRDGRSEIASIDARAAGSLFSIWSGDISLAVGAEYRSESFSDVRPPYDGTNPLSSGLSPDDNDILSTSPKFDSRGDRTVASAYSEVVIPLAAPQNNIPGVRLLEASASIRHERYSDFGAATKPKAGLTWRPLDLMMFRASINKGFNAPSLPLLNAPTQWSIASAPGSTDPYRNPATNEGPYQTRTIAAANPNLKATDSTGKSVGVVIDVPKIKGLSLTADYWQLSQSNIISSRSTAQVRNSDDVLLRAYTAQQVASGVPVGSIDVGSGTAAYKGDPDIVRSTPTPEDITAFAAYNATHPSAPLAVAGRIFSVATPPLNMAQGFASGWDFGLSYISPTLPVGRFTLDSDWAYVIKSYTINEPAGLAPIYTERLNIDGFTRWRSTTSLSWRKGDWSAGLSAYYISKGVDPNAPTTEAVYESLGRPDYIAKTFDAGGYVYR
ncbi:MAG: btuB 3 [Lacunisphaera sp.]|nr:btuB 3 [Lacunisphaera sp.]